MTLQIPKMAFEQSEGMSEVQKAFALALFHELEHAIAANRAKSVVVSEVTTSLDSVRETLRLARAFIRKISYGRKIGKKPPSTPAPQKSTPQESKDSSDEASASPEIKELAEQLQPVARDFVLQLAVQVGPAKDHLQRAYYSGNGNDGAGG